MICELDSVCVVVWRAEVTRRRFDKQRAALAEVVNRHGRNTAFLCIIEENVPPPSAELRAASTEMMAAHERELRCAALVIEGTGFKAALTRSVLLGMQLLLGGRKYPVSYFATVAEAAAWMASHRVVQSSSFVPDLRELRVQTEE